MASVDVSVEEEVRLCLEEKAEEKEEKFRKSQKEFLENTREYTKRIRAIKRGDYDEVDRILEFYHANLGGITLRLTTLSLDQIG